MAAKNEGVPLLASLYVTYGMASQGGEGGREASPREAWIRGFSIPRVAFLPARLARLARHVLPRASICALPG
jgi:hypothetical protein